MQYPSVHTHQSPPPPPLQAPASYMKKSTTASTRTNTHRTPRGVFLLPSPGLLILAGLLLACTSIAHLAYAEEAVPAPVSDADPTAAAEGDDAAAVTAENTDTPAVDAEPAVKEEQEEDPAESKKKPEWSYADPDTGPLAWGSLTTPDGKLVREQHSTREYKIRVYTVSGGCDTIRC